MGQLQMGEKACLPNYTTKATAWWVQEQRPGAPEQEIGKMQGRRPFCFSQWGENPKEDVEPKNLLKMKVFDQTEKKNKQTPQRGSGRRGGEKARREEERREEENPSTPKGQYEEEESQENKIKRKVPAWGGNRGWEIQNTGLNKGLKRKDCQGKECFLSVQSWWIVRTGLIKYRSSKSDPWISSFYQKHSLLSSSNHILTSQRLSIIQFLLSQVLSQDLTCGWCPWAWDSKRTLGWACF